MTDTASRRRLPPEDRRMEIILAAEQVLKAKGATARVEDVMAVANGAKGTFYRYFETWDDLLLALRDRIFDGFDQAYPLPDLTQSGPVDLWALFETQAVGFVDYMRQLDRLHDVIFHAGLADRHPIPIDQGAYGRIAFLLQQGVEAGLLPPIDGHATAPLIMALLHQTAAAIDRGEDPDRMLGAMLVMLKRSITLTDC